MDVDGGSSNNPSGRGTPADDPRLAAEGETAIARLSLATGDLPDAADHVARALAFLPTFPEAHEALAVLGRTAQGGVPLFTSLGGYIGAVAARAHLLASRGSKDEAVDLLLQVAVHEPARPWLDVPWFWDPDLSARLSCERLHRSLLTILPRLPDPMTMAHRVALEPLAALACAAGDRSDCGPDLLWLLSAVLRRFDRPQDALLLARRSYALAPSANASVMAAMALRLLGRLDEAEETLRTAWRENPEDTGILADLSELLVQMGQTGQAAAVLREGLSARPGDPALTTLSQDYEFRLTGRTEHLVELADSLTRLSGAARAFASGTLARASEDVPWLSGIVWPSEKTITLLNQTLAEHEPGEELDGDFALEALEVPSARMTLQRAFPRARIRVRGVPGPDDPREPVRPVQWRVWRYDGVDPWPTREPAPVTSTCAVRERTQVRWNHLPSLWEQTAQLGRIPLPDLLRVLTHPPTEPDCDLGAALRRHAPHAWVRAVQVTACCGIAHQQDGPWHSSTRRRVLADLMDGPEDWVCEAAAFAMVVHAWADPGSRRDVAALLADRLARTRRTCGDRTVSIAASLAQIALACPGIDESSRRVALSLAPQRPGGGEGVGETVVPDQGLSRPTSAPGAVDRLGVLRRWFPRRRRALPRPEF
jgi:tetratricopeptide (TPR) repeat protein